MSAGSTESSPTGDLAALACRPLALTPDNFTPPQRTPWGGRRLLDDIKRELPLDPAKAGYAVVGESWEVSDDPALPASVLPAGLGTAARVPLPTLLAAEPARMLGECTSPADGPGIPLVVKWIDAATALSLQVHPDDADPALRPDESGKFEVWYVVAASNDACLYLGFAADAPLSELPAALSAGRDIGAWLHRVPVRPGDCFAIPPGTVHAIGGGLTLIEPQRVRPGRSALTYRVWDWGRRYDASGRLSPTGAPRPLHVADFLRVARLAGPRGEDFVAPLRRARADGPAQPADSLVTLVDERGLRLERLVLTAGSALALPRAPRPTALLALSGHGEVATPGGVPVALPRGASVLLPAACAAVTVQATAGPYVVMAVTPT